MMKSPRSGGQLASDWHKKHDSSFIKHESDPGIDDDSRPARFSAPASLPQIDRHFCSVLAVPPRRACSTVGKHASHSAPEPREHSASNPIVHACMHFPTDVG